MENQLLIGPFFYINKKFIYNTSPLSEGREQAGKLDNSYGHDQLYDDHYKTGDYIDYPRGRVVFDKVQDRAIVYIDPCINNETVLSEIVRIFGLENYVVEYDDHYHCKKCAENVFE